MTKYLQIQELSALRKSLILQGKKDTYAYVADFTGFDELKFTAALYRKNVKLRYSLNDFFSKREQFQ